MVRPARQGGKAIEGRGDARSRDGHATRRHDLEKDLERARDFIRVQKRFAHSHEDDPHSLGPAARIVGDRVELADDLVGVHIPSASEPARHAERAVHCAPRLRRQAHGVFLERPGHCGRPWTLDFGPWTRRATRRSTRVFELVDGGERGVPRHEDRFHERSVGKAQAVLRAAVRRFRAPRDLRKRDRQLPAQPLAKRPGQLAHRGVVARAAAVNRVKDLPSAVARKPPALGQGLPIRDGKPQGAAGNIHQKESKPGSRTSRSFRSSRRLSPVIPSKARDLLSCFTAGSQGSGQILRAFGPQNDRENKRSPQLRARGQASRGGPAWKRSARADFARRVDANGLQEAKVLDIDPERGAVGGCDRFDLGLPLP